MKTLRYFLIGALLALPVILAVEARAEWVTSESSDEMTGERTFFAHSKSVNSTKPMGFPYRDVKSWAGVGCDGKERWAYLGFSGPPNLSDDRNKSGYNLAERRLKWDDNTPVKTSMTQDWGGRFLHFIADPKIIAGFMDHNTLLVEMQWHGEGRVYFRYPLAGATKAIQRCTELEKQ